MPIVSNTYSYNENFYLNKLKRLYNDSNLKVDHKLWGVYRNDVLAAYVVGEYFTDRLDFYNLLDMGRLYLVDEGIDKQVVMRAILPSLSNFYSTHKKGQFHLLCKCTKEETTAINIANPKPSPLLGQVFISREGLSEFKKILSINNRRSGYVGLVLYFKIKHHTL